MSRLTANERAVVVHRLRWHPSVWVVGGEYGPEKGTRG